MQDGNLYSSKILKISYVVGCIGYTIQSKQCHISPLYIQNKAEFIFLLRCGAKREVAAHLDIRSQAPLLHDATNFLK